MSGPVVKAIITTLDNLPLLKEQIVILRNDSAVDEIIVVSNGSKDGTNEWLAGQGKLVTAIIRDNNGAGPGRNAGLDAAGEFDYALMLDGGIRPLVGGTERMLDYLERIPEADVLGLEIPHFVTDPDKAWRRWPDSILPQHTYRNTCLSQTAYCLSRATAWDGLRFCEEGPFGEPGWGVDDDEMACQWLDAGIIVHVVTNIHPYRRASGSFRRLYQETGIWPNQFGSVYEKRLVWMQQRWPQYGKGTMWGAPDTVIVVKVTTVETTAKAIKTAHDKMRQRKQEPPWEKFWLPYHVVAWMPNFNPAFAEWAEPRRLRQHQGDTIIADGQIVRRNKDNEELWTGDFIVCKESTYDGAVWLGAKTLVIESEQDVRRQLEW